MNGGITINVVLNVRKDTIVLEIIWSLVLKDSKKDEKYIESLEKQNTEMKNIISEYYDLVEEMLMYKKRDTEKAVKIMVKVGKIHKGVKL